MASVYRLRPTTTVDQATDMMGMRGTSKLTRTSATGETVLK